MHRQHGKRDASNASVVSFVYDLDREAGRRATSMAVADLKHAVIVLSGRCSCARKPGWGTATLANAFLGHVRDDELCASRAFVVMAFAIVDLIVGSASAA